MDELDRITRATVRVVPSQRPGAWDIGLSPDGEHITTRVVTKDSRGDAVLVAEGIQAALAAAITRTVHFLLATIQDGKQSPAR
jgi:hypothetical protein